MEGNCQKTDASIVSRSSEPFIQIDSITIDLISSDDKIDCGKCEHFSIRQFVSEMRKKDWKVCWPFALDGDQESGDQKSLLPPLQIPNFSWWRCPNCQHEISSKDFHPVSKLGAMEKRSIDICNSKNLNEYNNPSSYTGVRGKRAEVGGSISGNVIGSGDGNMEMHRFSSSAPKIISSGPLERCINNSVAPKPESNGSRESCQSGHGSRKVGAVELGVANVQVNGKNHVENFQTGKHISTDDECRLLCQASEICRVVDKRCDTTIVRDQSKSDPAIEVNKRILSTSEFTEILVGNNIPDSHVHKTSGSLRQKNRKHRLLTELLGENRSMKNKQVVVTTNFPSNGTPDASTRIDTVYVPPSQVVVRGSNGEGPCQSRKRSLIQDKEWRPQEISSGNENKSVKALKKDLKTNEFSIGYKPEKSFDRTGLKTMKSRLSKSRLNRDHMLDRRKYKKPIVLHPGFPLLQPRENVLQEIQEKHASVYSWMDSFPLTGERMESKSSLCAKKGNIQFKEVVETPLFWDNDLLRPGSTAREDVETMRNQSVATPFQSRKDEFSDRVLHLSLSSYMAAQRLDTNCVPQGGDRLPSFRPHHGGTSALSQFSRKENENKTPLDLTSRFISSDALVTQGVQGELNKKVSTYRIPFPVERQQLTPQCEDSVCSHLQRMAIAGPSSCMKNTEDRECLAIKKKQKDKRVDNAYEKGAADDIPMEIVELMAKNQFERELYDAENKRHLLETENSTRKAPMAYNGNSFINESSRFLQVQEKQKPKPHARNKNNGVIASKEVVRPNKQSPVDYLSHISGCHFNQNHLQQTHSSEGYGEAIQSQMKTSREIQYSAAGSSKIGKALHGKYWGNVEDPRSSYSRVHAFEGCREHLSVSLQNEERARICSQMMLNPSSFGCNTPQKGSEKSKNADKFSNGHTSTDKANFSAYSLQALSRTNAECPYSYQSTGVEIHQKPMNSLDLCSNETIPAMHLLSLMDAGMQSNPSFTPAGTSKFPKKAPFSVNLKPDEFSRFDIVSNRKIDTVRFPLSDYYSGTHLSKKSIDRLPAGAALCKSTSLQQAKRFSRASNFSDKFSSKSTKKETTKRSVVSPWKRSQKSQKCVVTSDGMGTDNDGALSFFDLADSALFTVGCQKNRRVSQHILEDRGSNATLLTMKRPIDTGVCTVNKNPSDFSLPEAGNIYTIGADDLKFGQNLSSATQSCCIVSDGRKKRRNAKHNVVNEYAHHLIQS